MLVCHQIDLSTSPEQITLWWLVQSLILPNWRAGRPVPKRTVLGGRCGPQISKLADWTTSPEHRVLGGRCSPQISKLVDWTTSPRAYSAWWSVQSPDLQTGRLDDQSSSIQCSVVGAVPRNVDPPPIFVCYFEKSILPHK